MSLDQYQESSIQKVTRTPVHRQVQEAIRQFILENDLQPGSQLPPEGQLANLFGVSRNSVREGVKALEVQGVVEVRVGAGLFVQEFSFEPILETLPYGLLVDMGSIKHLLHLREVLDRGVVGLLIANSCEEQVQSLEEILDEWEIIASEGGYDPLLDRRFHQCLYSGLDNPLLSKIAGLFWDTLHRALDAAEFSHVEDPVETVELHRNMLDAIRLQDATAMTSAIDTHYPGIWSHLYCDTGPIVPDPDNVT